MIPKFPEFKKIEIQDKNDIEFFTRRYKPYSDFNFSNLWAWNTIGGREISVLNENLVVLFTDYRTTEKFYSFLGNTELETTTRDILNLAEATGIKNQLHFIQEESVQQIRKAGFQVIEDEENFDYIFAAAQLANHKGSKFKVKRHLANKFLRDYPEARFEQKELNDKATQAQIITVMHSWEQKKRRDFKTTDIVHEEKALNRILETAATHDLILSCIFLHGKMLAFSIDELLPNNYALSHFIKADATYRGIYEYLNEHVAKYLVSQDVVLWNWEQDLNIDGLRKLKMSYRPVSFLKKFRVSKGRQHKKTLFSSLFKKITEGIF